MKLANWLQTLATRLAPRDRRSRMQRHRRNVTRQHYDVRSLTESLEDRTLLIAPVNLSVSAATGTEVGTTAITVTATADSAVLGNETVSLAVTGTGITASDYDLSNSTITILNGSTTGTVTFTVKDDLLNEGDETATLTISSPSSGLTLGTTTTRDITITDDDNAGTSNRSSRQRQCRDRQPAGRH